MDLELRVTGMTCEQCAASVAGALERLEGVEARMSYPDAAARVRVPEGFPVERLLDAVRVKGYGAEIVSGAGPAPRARRGAGLRVSIAGGGSAAFACALRLAEQGARVTLIEAGTIGGTCVNVGCVPSKIMIRGAQLAQYARHQPFEGLRLALPQVDRGLLVAQQQRRVEELRYGKYEALIEGDRPQFVYVAAAAGTRAAENMLGGEAALDLSAMPAVIFTDPQVATVGLDEPAARKRGIGVDTRTLTLDNVPRALANFDTRGFVKLVAEAGSGRLLGAQIVAHDAGEIIQIAALAIRHRMRLHDLAGELFPYLTMAEGIKLCAQTFTRDVKKLSCCAG